MPLAIGNQWQYKVRSIVYGPPNIDTAYYSLSIVERDTIMPNGYQYQVVKSSNSTSRYVHIDSATACVYENTWDPPPGLKTDSLRCSEGDWFGVDIYCEFIDTATVLNYHTCIMSIDRSWPDITVRHTLAMDIGMTYQYIFTSGGWGATETLTLVYAKINGNEFGELVTSLNDISNKLLNFELYQNYPNPFNPITRIKYSVPARSFVSLKVFDVLGNKVAALVEKEKPAGEYKVEFDGRELTSGIYFYQLIAGNYGETKKMILMK
jgi:hypothetical protein